MSVSGTPETNDSTYFQWVACQGGGFHCFFTRDWRNLTSLTVFTISIQLIAKIYEIARQTYIWSLLL
jgi:hypothetical protein